MLDQIQQKLDNSQPIDRDEALWLLIEADLLSLGKLADGMRRKMHPQRRVSFVVDRNVNYTNVCVYRCRFCAFYRRIKDDDAYVLPFEEIAAKVSETVAAGGTGILLQGGVHPENVRGSDRIREQVPAELLIVGHAVDPHRPMLGRAAFGGDQRPIRERFEMIDPEFTDLPHDGVGIALEVGWRAFLAGEA